MLNTSSYTYWSFVLLPFRIPCLIHLPITSQGYWIFRGWNFLSFLYILDINPSSDELLAKIFYYLGGSVLFPVTVSFAVQKLFSLMQLHFFILSLRCWTFSVLFRKSFPMLSVLVYFLQLPVVFSVSVLTLISLMSF
jgi:hypothetical protein